MSVLSYNYTCQPRQHYLVEHRMRRIELELTIFIEPYYHCGFSAEQIKAELDMKGERHVPLGHVQAILNKLAWEEQA